jgi:hypothetical protein
MQFTPDEKAMVWERMVRAAIPVTMAVDVSIEEASGMAMEAADRLLEGYLARFQEPVRQEEEIYAWNDANNPAPGAR